MSQVIVTNDDFKQKRLRSREQEKQIAKEAMYQRWRKMDVNTFRPLAIAIGIATIPVVAFWGLLLGLMGFALSIFTVILKTAGKLAGNKP